MKYHDNCTIIKIAKVFLRIEAEVYKMKITIEDVAREAGVSITTVSRVINNNYPVKEETRKRVEEAILKFNFTPNSLARGLIQKKTYSIGVLVPSITNLFFPTVVKGIDRSLKERGYTVLLCDTEGEVQAEKAYVQNLMERRVDGIISIDPQTENIKSGFYEAITKQIPFVLINGYHRGIRCNFVLNDEEMGTIEALEYLIDMGHRNIVLLRGDHSYSYDLKEEVFYDVLNKHNILARKDQVLSIKAGNSIQTVALSTELIYEKLKESPRPTAIFACNDWMATGALYAAQRLGIKVPEQLSIIGYDNIIISQLSQPKLTTVDQNMYKLGQLAADMLQDLAQKKMKNYKKIILDTKLVKRDSCSPM